MQNPFAAHNQVQQGHNLSMKHNLSRQATFEPQSDLPVKSKPFTK